MESNKLLIGVQFIDSIKTGKSYVIELIVLRDLTVKQLIDGINYGLAKKCAGGDSICTICRDVFNECISVCDGEGNLKRVSLTSHSSSAYNRSVSDNRALLNLSDLNKTISDVGFISSTRIVFDPSESYRSYDVNTSAIIPAFNPKNTSRDAVTFPDYNISTRQLYKFDDTPVEIISAPSPPNKPEQNLFFMLLPTILMMSMMVLVRGFMSMNGTSSFSMVIFSVSMSAVTLVMSIINFIRQKKKYKEALERWKKEYEDYIDKTVNNITERQKNDTLKLNELYPDINDLINEKIPGRSIYSVSGDIFSRCSEDEDFLCVRLGISDMIDNKFQIKGSKSEVIFSSTGFKIKFDKVKIYISEDEEYDNKDDETYYLSNLPNFISEKYKYMKRAPFLFSLKNCGMLGIVSPNPVFAERMIQRMILDMCFYHSPDDLQFVYLFDPTDDIEKIESCIGSYKFLPHFRNLFPDRAQFVFDDNNANMVFSAMLSIIAERIDAKGQGVHFPHIVFVVSCEYDLKEHAFAQFLPQMPPQGSAYQNELGITFIFTKSYKEYLPRYCNCVIEFKDDHNASLTPHEDSNEKRDFSFNMLPDWKVQLYNTSKILSSLCYSKISENGKVPSAVSIFELYGFTKNNIDIASFWEESAGSPRINVIETLSVPIGKTESGLTYLDLHEDFDGPHMLVAGTTGSGKSETIITYLLGLCLFFRPDEVNLMLVDMKGGGFIKRIGTLPHVVGSVTDVDGDENGTGAEYMLKRFLDALRSEIKRRKILFNSMHVDSINQYIAACKNIDAHINSINNRLRGEDKEPLSNAEVEKAGCREFTRAPDTRGGRVHRAEALLHREQRR